MPQSSLLGQYAGFVTRAVGWSVDLAVISLTVLTLNWVARATLLLINVDIANCSPITTGLQGLIADFCTISRIVMSIISLAIAPFYFIFFWILGGQTVGKYVAGVRVVQLDGRPLTVRTALIRLLGYILSLIPLGFGFLWSVIDDRRMGWHDKLAQTCVIYAWKARPDEGFSAWLNERLRLRREEP